MKYRHKKRGSEYQFVTYALWTGDRCHEDNADLGVIEKAPSLWVATDNYINSDYQWARLQTDRWIEPGDVVVVYRAMEDNSLWVRHREEFEDGRFEEIKE